ncbi:unnamed protein product [Ilex paraguariensis]|uniref:Uncharacterized protein n=1 Tax=Ilex paraguariensis TaxID=185542 RepID=A0ABC8RQX1_9AQUA
MAAAQTRKISAAAARSHTRKTKHNSSVQFSSRMIVPIAIAMVVGVLGWVYVAIKPPPPNVCGSPGGPPVTSPRVKLSDGRHLAYKVTGVSKEEAKYKIIIIHGFDGSKDFSLPVSQSFG